MGRPSSYEPNLAQSILDRLAEGEPLAQICRDEGMPSGATVRNWCDAGHVILSGGQEITFGIAYARARDDGFDAIALDVLHIADETGQDTRYGKDGQEAPDSEWISRSRLRAEMRLKLLAKWDPKRYGEKMDVTSAGERIGDYSGWLDGRGAQPE